MNVLLDTNVILDLMLERDPSDDNLQMACAVNTRVDAIITRNPKDFGGSPVPVLTPAELMSLLEKAADT